VLKGVADLAAGQPGGMVGERGVDLFGERVAGRALERPSGQLRLDEHARALWWRAYTHLAEPQDAIAGQICARAEAHTIRLALIYALIDGARQINREHSKPRSR
jgi:hypothetical protein